MTETWKEAIYDGKKVPNLWVSDQGRMRRSPEGEATRGTPNIDRKHNYLRSYQVCIPDHGYHRKHRAVNLHRIVWETFSGEKWIPGYQIDHIDRCVGHGNFENLRMVSRQENMRNRNLKLPQNRDSNAAWYRYNQCLKYSVRRFKDLPREIQLEYYRMYAAEKRAKRKQKVT